MSWPCLWNLI